MEVKIHADVLDRVARELTTLSGTLPGLLDEARRLEVSWATAGLTEVPAWAQDTTVDLRARIGLVRMAENQKVTGLALPGGFDWTDVAGARTRVSLALANLGGAQQLQTQQSTTATWARRPGESLDDWVVRVQGQALEQLPLLDGHGQPIAEGLDWYGGYLDMLAAGGWSAASALTVGKAELAKAVLPKLEQVLTPRFIALGFTEEGVAARFASLRVTYATYKAPGTTMQSLLMKVIPSQQLNRVPPRVSQWLTSTGLRHTLPAAEGALPASAGNAMKTVFGTGWTSADGSVTLPRGASNLVTVGKEAAWGDKVASVGRTAGVLRGVGIVGGVASTGYDVANLISEGDPREAFAKDKAGYVADVSKTLFDGSMTAAMIAPSPVTWGAVAVTGAVYAGAELVDHWDDVKHTTGAAAGWLGDRAHDAGHAVTDGLDAVAHSKVNPMNWF